jgi:CheY-like chemotaxis protein
MKKKSENLILIVDDQEDDRVVLKRMLSRAGVTNPIVCLGDGHEAIGYLKGDGAYHDRRQFPLPAAIFLDLNMPVMSGWEVLDWMGKAGMTEKMRIFVYSQPKSLREVHALYTCGANSFIQKPVMEYELEGLIQNFPGIWELRGKAEVT